MSNRKNDIVASEPVEDLMRRFEVNSDVAAAKKFVTETAARGFEVNEWALNLFKNPATVDLFGSKAVRTDDRRN